MLLALVPAASRSCDTASQTTHVGIVTVVTVCACEILSSSVARACVIQVLGAFKILLETRIVITSVFASSKLHNLSPVSLFLGLKDVKNHDQSDLGSHFRCSRKHISCCQIIIVLTKLHMSHS